MQWRSTITWPGCSGAESTSDTFTSLPPPLPPSGMCITAGDAAVTAGGAPPAPARADSAATRLRFARCTSGRSGPAPG
eukprot:150301-Chlamydomonas_euryale.AAC.1